MGLLQTLSVYCYTVLYLLACIEGLDEVEFEESEDLEPHLTGLAQDDPEVVQVLRDYFLQRPNFNFPTTIDQRYLKPGKLQGQFGQARFVDDLYDSSKRNGFFFEAGAYDGVAASNTLFFELHRNWTGVLVEPNPEAYDALLGTNRQAWSLKSCLATKPEVEVVNFDAAAIFGGIVQDGRIRPGDNLPMDNATQMNKEYVAQHRKFIKMQCFPLYSILLALDNPVVDYLSLDVEGAELKILQTIPWDQVDIRVISLEICRRRLNRDLTEDDGDFTDDYDEIVSHLELNGYRLHSTWSHTYELLCFESLLVKRGVRFAGIDNGRSLGVFDSPEGKYEAPEQLKEALSKAAQLSKVNFMQNFVANKPDRHHTDEL